MISISFYYFFDCDPTQRDSALHIAILVTAFTTLHDFFLFPRHSSRLSSPLIPLRFKYS